MNKQKILTMTTNVLKLFWNAFSGVLVAAGAVFFIETFSGASIPADQKQTFLFFGELVGLITWAATWNKK